MASIVQAPAANDPKSQAGGKQFVDILCIDDMENVSKRLRTMIPRARHGSARRPARRAALAICASACSASSWSTNDIPDVDSSSLMRQLRVMQPQAAVVMFVAAQRGQGAGTRRARPASWA